MLDKKGFTIIELAVVAGIFLLMIAILAPAAEMINARSRKTQCADNLRAISLGLYNYAADHGDRFPARFGDLHPEYVKDANAFNCPGTKKSGTPGDPEYTYITGLTVMSPASEIVAKDMAGNHNRPGGNNLMVGGSVAWEIK